MYKKIMFISLYFFLFISSTVFAHPGSLDELGGHFRNSDCVYLLHEPTEIAKSVKNMDELIALIQQYNRNQCKEFLTPSKVDTEGFKISGEVKNSYEPFSELELGKVYHATLEKCVDGDTAHFKINGKVYKARFLYIDTPEYTKKKEPYGKKATEYTCRLLHSGTIQVETDGPSLFDKYERLLVWVWVDGQLLQELITKQGFVKDFYDYGQYKYEDRIQLAMKEAKKNNVGIYSAKSKKTLIYKFIISMILCGIFLLLISFIRKKFR